MNFLKNAIKFFREEKYEEAIGLFEKAGDIYGKGVVEANLHYCKRALEKIGDKSKKDVYAGGAAKSSSLDSATLYMLSNMGKINLGEEKRHQILEEYNKLTSRKSEEADVKPVNPIPADWPKELILAPLPESTNDWCWHMDRKPSICEARPKNITGLSIIIPTFNRSNILDITLACLVNQDTNYIFEVVVADDGSQEAIDQVVRRYESMLDIKYVRQKDYGYQLCAARNLGMRTAKYEFIAILDCDMAPSRFWVESYMSLLTKNDDIALIGPRKYVDTSSYNSSQFLLDKSLIENLPEVFSPDILGRKQIGEVSIDWRLDHFRQTDDLRLCDTPFRYFSGGNVAFARRWLQIAGWFDEEFTHWGGEDNEFGYRLYRHGCFFRAVWGAMAYHQEPPGKENETDRAEGKKVTINIVREKVPYFYRTIMPLTSATLQKKPLVSIYVPAYNCAEHIVRCVDSALNQTVVDLEVCVCNDGSTDSTLDVLKRHYGQNPRVHVLTQVNGGIGRASNAAVRMTKGYYIGQLDSDDYLEPDAVELCLKEFLADRKLACVYTTNRNVNPDGSLIAKGYNWPLYSREKLTTAMIAHHFRMFTARAWHLTEGFDESITNAVDYDMYLKISEVGPFKHVNKISYNRVLHGENTSIKKQGVQKQNHFKVVNDYLGRQAIKNIQYLPLNEDDSACKKYWFKMNSKNKLGSVIALKDTRPIVGLIKFNVISKHEVGSYISSRERPWDDHVASILDYERLRFRLDLLINGSLKQISLQTLRPERNWFRLIIVTSTLLPLDIKTQLYALQKKYPWLQIVEKNPDEWIGAEQLISTALNEITCNLLDGEGIPFLSFRLDDDDFLPVDYLERCQCHIVKQNINKFLTFKNGAKILWNRDKIKICNYETIERPFIAIGLGAICGYDLSVKEIYSKVRSVFVGINHHELKDSCEYIVDDSEDMFIWSHHPSQDTFGRFKSVEFNGEWEKIPENIIERLYKYPALSCFL